MINELVKEKREQVDREETNKMLNAIHRQAKESYYFEKAKRYIKKDTKKEFKERLINDTLNFALLVFIIPVLVLLAVIS